MVISLCGWEKQLIWGSLVWATLFLKQLVPGARSPWTIVCLYTGKIWLKTPTEVWTKQQDITLSIHLRPLSPFSRNVLFSCTSTIIPLNHILIFNLCGYHYLLIHQLHLQTDTSDCIRDFPSFCEHDIMSLCKPIAWL